MIKNNDFYWSKLDNTGTLYASITTLNNPNIYRLSVKLKEKVDKDTLEVALFNTLQTIPSFNVKLRKGFFWYYLERNHATPIVRRDTHFPFMDLNDYYNNYFLFSVTYYEKRINIDFSHILTDGMGGFKFLTTLVINYMKLKHPRRVKQSIIAGPELVPSSEMGVDSFSKYAKVKIDKKKIMKDSNNKRAYLINGPKRNREDTNVMIGTISVNQLKNITKQQNVSLTTYLTAVLIYSIYHGNLKYTKSKEPIIICIPVDLRQHFPSSSMNNFFTTISISVDVANNDYSFDDILKLVSSKLQTELDKSVLLDKFKTYTTLQQNIALRFFPLVLKDAVLRGVSSLLAGRGATTTLSNLGIIKVDNDVKEFVERFDVITYTEDLMPIKIGMCSFEDKLSVSISSRLINTEIERSFFTYLTKQGIDVGLSTSTNDEEDGK